MDADGFDTLSRSLSASASSRRRLLTIFAGGALGALATVLGVAEAGATHIGCRHAGKPCARNTQCCSHRCSAHGTCKCPAGTTRVGGRCQLIGSFCPAGANQCVAENTLCPGTSCHCYEDRTLTSRCLKGDAYQCVNCVRNSDCDTRTGVSSACVPMVADWRAPARPRLSAWPHAPE